MKGRLRRKRRWLAMLVAFVTAVGITVLVSSTAKAGTVLAAIDPDGNNGTVSGTVTYSYQRQAINDTSTDAQGFNVVLSVNKVPAAIPGKDGIDNFALNTTDYTVKSYDYYHHSSSQDANGCTSNDVETAANVRSEAAIHAAVVPGVTIDTGYGEPVGDPLYSSQAIFPTLVADFTDVITGCDSDSTYTNTGYLDGDTPASAACLGPIVGDYNHIVGSCNDGTVDAPNQSFYKESISWDLTPDGDMTTTSSTTTQTPSSSVTMPSITSPTSSSVPTSNASNSTSPTAPTSSTGISMSSSKSASSSKSTGAPTSSSTVSVSNPSSPTTTSPTPPNPNLPFTISGLLVQDVRIVGGKGIFDVGGVQTLVTGPALVHVESTSITETWTFKNTITGAYAPGPFCFNTFAPTQSVDPSLCDYQQPENGWNLIAANIEKHKQGDKPMIDYVYQRGIACGTQVSCHAVERYTGLSGVGLIVGVGYKVVISVKLREYATPLTLTLSASGLTLLRAASIMVCVPSTNKCVTRTS